MKRSALFLLPLLAVLSTPAVPASADSDEPWRRRIGLLCGQCHGENGVSVRPGVPHLAGQKLPYLATQLRRFREHIARDLRPFRLSERQSHTMNGIADSMSDLQIAAIAAYYAGLACDIPDPAAPPPAAPDIVQRCVRCHGEDGRGGDDTPIIAGQREDYLIQALAAIKESVLAKGREVMQKDVAPSELPRYHRTMGDWAARMSDDEIAAAAEFYARLPCRD